MDLISSIPHWPLGPDRAVLEEVLLRYAREGLTLAQRVAATNSDLGYSLGYDKLGLFMATKLFLNLKFLFFIIQAYKTEEVEQGIQHTKHPKTTTFGDCDPTHTR